MINIRHLYIYLLSLTLSCVCLNLMAQDSWFTENDEVSFGIGLGKVDVGGRKLSNNVLSLNIYGITFVTGSTHNTLDGTHKALHYHIGYSLPILRFLSITPVIGDISIRNSNDKFDYGLGLRLKIKPKKMWTMSVETLKTKYMFGIMLGIRWNLKE